MSFYQLDFEREIVELDERIRRAEQGRTSTEPVEIPAFGGVEGARPDSPEGRSVVVGRFSFEYSPPG